MNKNSRIKLDILRFRPIAAVVASPLFPVVLQVIALLGVLALALNGLGTGLDMKSTDMMVLRKTNLTTLFVWGLWWPCMIAAALAFGRAWCTVCPLELINRAACAFSGFIGLPKVRPGRFLGAGWMTVALYLLLQLLVAGVSMHRVPHFTGILLFALIAVAFLSGIIFRGHRSFCKIFCPSSALLSVYGRYTPVQIEVRDPLVCESCSTRDCIAARNCERFDRRSCPSNLIPFRRQPSDGCVLCFQCAKVCPHKNIGAGIVTQDAPVRRKNLLLPFEAVFVMIAFGFVAHEVIGEVKWLDAFFHAVPLRLSGFFTAVPFGWLEALWFLALFPAMIWGIVSLAGYLSGQDRDFRSLLLAAATGAAPVVAVAHLAKASAKIASWSGFLPLALGDPQGVETMRLIQGKTLTAPAEFIGISLLGWIMLALVFLTAMRALRWFTDIPAHSLAAARIGLAVTFFFFSAVFVVWVHPALVKLIQILL